MPRVRVNALVGSVHIQDPYPASGALSVTAPAASYAIFDCSWEQLQRIAPQLASLDAAGVATFSIYGTTANFWAQEGDLAGMPRIDTVSKHDLTETGETGLSILGYELLAGQTFASTIFADADADAVLTIYARTPGSWGNALHAEIIDSGSSGLAVTLTHTDTLTINLGAATPTATAIAAAVNAEATVYLLFKAVAGGTGSSDPVAHVSQDLAGGEGPGMAVTCAGIACDVRTIVTTYDPVITMTVDVPTMAGVVSGGEAVNLEIRTGAKVATVSLAIAP